ncbi:hypothetical protein QTG54_007918 [Skeletonema marinoi]|uniref:Uncharacterized protein n=1 Tax=Skeletonema marinoi TaxID=267567 RepID=A0AAD8YAF0_9STRA|nr:hypothetical protein QTG54_007918 [Skeletonema marinoi]
MTSSTDLPAKNNSTSVVSKRTTNIEQSINTHQHQQSIRIHVIDSRDDIFTVVDDDKRPLSRDNSDEKEEAETKPKNETATSADARKITELRQAILEMRVYTCKLKGTNRHLQGQNELVKGENTSLANTIHRLEKDGIVLREENEQLRRELKLLKKGTLDTNMSIISSLGDDVCEIDENSLANDLVPLSITIDPKLQFTPTQHNGGGESDDVQDNEKTTKLIGKPCVTPTSDLRTLTTSRDTTFFDEPNITITNDEEENDDVNLRMELGQCREQCEELQKDLKKIAQDYWKQREELKEYRSRADELQTKKGESERLKWVEAEVDAMWAQVKKTDKANQEWLVELETLRAEKEVWRASVVDKSNEIAELKEKLRNAPCPDWIQSALQDIQNDLKQMKMEQHRQSS